MKTLKFEMKNSKPISNKLYGLFFEDINFSIDGGINSNQINNAMFNFRYRKKIKNLNYYLKKIKKFRKRITYIEHVDYFRYWNIDGKIALSQGISNGIGKKEKNYPLLTVSGEGVLSNIGYNGGKGTHKKGRYYRDHSQLGAIGVKENHTYNCSFFIKNQSYEGTIEVFIDCNGERITKSATAKPEKGNWTQINMEIVATKTAIGKFVLCFQGQGTIALDAFYFGDKDSLGTDSLQWSGGKLRKDLVEALRELKPKFVRFPGGCIVEGYNLNNGYYWKNTVGNLFDRKPQINLWGDAQADGGYMQSYEVGFYEYFMLCEHLNAEPMPILNAGLACQGRIVEHCTTDDKEFQRYIDDAVDLIEYANGDTKDNKWAKLRAQSGHPKPFNLRMIGIGNENWGEVYLKNFAAIKAVIKEKYPYMEIIWSAGFDCYKHKNYNMRREGFNGVHDDCIVDDHFYREPKWCIDNADMYDDYDQKARIFLGEYAANIPWDEIALPNNYYSALAEAVFLTNIERNADKVIMASYAPLFSRIGGEQWKHNLINFNSLYTLRTANYYVQKLYSNNIGDNYIECKNNIEGVYQSATFDDKYIYIKLININYESVELEIDFNDVKLSETSEVWSLQCSDNYARNTMDYDGEPVETIKPKESKIVFASSKAIINLEPRSFYVIKVKIKE